MHRISLLEQFRHVDPEDATDPDQNPTGLAAMEYMWKTMVKGIASTHNGESGNIAKRCFAARQHNQ